MIEGILSWHYLFFIFFLRFYLFIFRERGREGEREGEKHQCVVASQAPPTGDLTCNPGMCPDWELKRRPFGSQAYAQSTELNQPGTIFSLLKLLLKALSNLSGSHSSLLFSRRMRITRYCPFFCACLTPLQTAAMWKHREKKKWVRYQMP